MIRAEDDLIGEGPRLSRAAAGPTARGRSVRVRRFFAFVAAAALESRGPEPWHAGCLPTPLHAPTPPQTLGTPIANWSSKQNCDPDGTAK